MCGIIGYIGNKNVKEVLIEGLEQLEYRGYDSAGVCLSNNQDKEIIKSVGKVSLLKEKINNESKIDAIKGIAHTRWATNGEANIVNSHPLSQGKITLVHNGIIENAEILKKKLIDLGYQFISDTDSEVISAIIDYYYKKTNDIIKAIDESTKELIGSYALVIIVDNNENLYAIRKDSPLIIGIGENDYYAASDITAISNYTNKCVYLNDNEIAVLGKSLKFYKDLNEVHNEIKEVNAKSNDLGKNGYPHYMLKEIMEEPEKLKSLINTYIDNDEDFNLSKYDEIHIVACGSAMYAGMVGKYLIEEYANIFVNVFVASEYRYMKKIYKDKEKTLVILISQSGETADTIAAMREAKETGIETLGIVNNPTSTIAREANRVILTNGGVEIAVATTKAYILQVAIMSIIAIKTGINKGIVEKTLLDEYIKIPNILNELLNRHNDYEAIAKEIYNIQTSFFIGRLIDYAMCLEGSLKLKEISYINSQAYQAGELKHGTISLIEKNMVVFTIITNSKLKEKTLSNLKETEARGAKGVIITTNELDDFDNHLKIVIPTVNDYLQPLLVVPVLQMLAYYIANFRGCDIDKPKNLAKSVTVE